MEIHWQRWLLINVYGLKVIWFCCCCCYGWNILYVHFASNFLRFTPSKTKWKWKSKLTRSMFLRIPWFYFFFFFIWSCCFAHCVSNAVLFSLIFHFELYSMEIGYVVYVFAPHFYFIWLLFFSPFALFRCRRVKCANQEINCTSFTDKINKYKMRKKREKKKTTVTIHADWIKEMKREEVEKQNKTHDNMMWKWLLNLCHRTLHFIWRAWTAYTTLWDSQHGRWYAIQSLFLIMH